ncbi:ATP-dependent helicase [Acetobacterium sp.]|uniref:ATP-dependent helicase n=1 Tax=Acetobacterium sp. TaxID=1872094 RepID=UPI002F3F95C9
MSLLDGLNSRQREAAETINGPLLILAGAGSGKTRTIIHRIAHIIETGQAWPSQILAITFTNKAAGEMRERIAKMEIEDSKRIWMSTFHAMCARIMRIHSQWLGYDDNFVIYDMDDQKRLYKTLVKELELNDKYYTYQYVGNEVSTAKNNFVSPEAYIKENAEDYRKEKVGLYYRRYQESLKANNAMDFDDLIYNTLVLFKGFPEILEQYQNKFKFILVDEYQDTNHSQYELVNMLAAKYNNLCVCGDDDQSIYGWRGADINNILDFEKDYKGAKIIKLEENYRSTQVILDGANSVISKNTGRKEKALWTKNTGDEKIMISSFNQGYDEARFIVDEIKTTVTEGNGIYGDFAILYRTNAQSRLFEEALMREDLPFQLIGGTGFYSRLEIKDVIAYLNVLSNPKDNIGFLRIVNVPKRGIGAATIDKIGEYAAFKSFSLMEAFHHVEEIPELSPSVRNKVRAFSELMTELSELKTDASLSALITGVIEKSGYIEMLELGKMDKGESRLENLQELVSSATEFEKNSDDQSLSAYLETVALSSETDKYDGDEGKVLLMTLHNAKGLEFPIVFLPGLEEGIFPHGRAMDSPDEIEEERRICYVGITRAMKRLYISWAAERNLYGRKQLQAPSRFLKEIPEEVCVENKQRYERKPEIDSQESRKKKTFSERVIQSKVAIRRRSSHAIRHITENSFGLSDKVRHKKFGVGTVVEVKNNMISVAFPGVGIKKMDPGFVEKA